MKKQSIERISLQQARKNAGIPLSVMAEILITDTSNLSKYERGIRKAPADIVVSYHLLTGVPLEPLFKERISINAQLLIHKVHSYIGKLEKEIKSFKVESFIERLTACLTNIKCLSDINETHHE